MKKFLAAAARPARTCQPYRAVRHIEPATFHANAIAHSRGFTGLFVFVAGRIIPAFPGILAFSG